MRRIKLITAALLLLCLCACGNTEDSSWNGMEKTGSLELQYAKEFQVDYYEDGYDVITIQGDEYLLVPEGMPVPDEIGSEVTVLQQPLENLYVASSSAMDLFLHAGAIDRVDMTSTSAENWTIPEIQAKVVSDDILFVGKYSAPDYEVVLDEDCGLAVENTMISHSPEVKEKLEQLGIPVLVERSSYEESPLGRVEWIKLYGLLTGHLDTAEEFFESSVQQVQAVEKETKNQGGETPTVVFFYFTVSGYVNVRTPDDYISQMIDLAGGKYAFSAEELGEQGTRSSVNMDPEQFYAAAKDADILIYNSTVEGEISSLDALLEKSPLMKDCKAVLNGTVWCTGQNMFQQVSGTAEMISDLHAVISGDSEQSLTFLHRLS
jgi:iron complex transport system substrate-binding protein